MTNTFKIGQESLRNFAQSVAFQNPRVAALMHTDILSVGMQAMSLNKTKGQASAVRLRKMCMEHDLPEIHRRVLETALENLGYE